MYASSQINLSLWAVLAPLTLTTTAPSFFVFVCLGLFCLAVIFASALSKQDTWGRLTARYKTDEVTQRLSVEFSI